jgi:hypothetical protein
LPKQSSPLLMLMPSFRSKPVAPVRLRRSEPAKSTKWNLAVICSSVCPGSPLLPSIAMLSSISLTIFYSIAIVKIAWDRLEPSFIRVALVVRREIPLLRSSRHYSWQDTGSSFKP